MSNLLKAIEGIDVKEKDVSDVDISKWGYLLSVTVNINENGDVEDAPDHTIVIINGGYDVEDYYAECASLHVSDMINNSGSSDNSIFSCIDEDVIMLEGTHRITFGVIEHVNKYWGYNGEDQDEWSEFFFVNHYYLAAKEEHKESKLGEFIAFNGYATGELVTFAAKSDVGKTIIDLESTNFAPFGTFGGDIDTDYQR